MDPCPRLTKRITRPLILPCAGTPPLLLLHTVAALPPSLLHLFWLHCYCQCQVRTPLTQIRPSSKPGRELITDLRCATLSLLPLRSPASGSTPSTARVQATSLSTEGRLFAYAGSPHQAYAENAIQLESKIFLATVHKVLDPCCKTRWLHK